MNEIDAFNAKWDVQLRKGTLELVMLAVLNGRTLYGLEILHALHRYETIQISEGTLYPLLDRLKRDGLVSAKWVQEGETRPRKYYALTEAGQSRLKLMHERWRLANADINHLLENPGQTSAQSKEKK